jgi:hypothetical protein
MTPIQKIKHLILVRAADFSDLPAPEGVTAENIDDLYDEADEDSIQDARNEVRSGEFETDLPCDYSRHYESKSVAAQTANGSWVGWTYWYGGGKHGEPEAIEWMDDAYDLAVSVEEKMTVVHTFAKVEQPA